MYRTKNLVDLSASVSYSIFQFRLTNHCSYASEIINCQTKKTKNSGGFEDQVITILLYWYTH
jgi:hypothetical protein